jgi:replicative DNA helicase
MSDTNPQAELKRLHDQLHLLAESSSGDGWKDMTELMVNLYKHQDEMTKTDGKGLQTKFPLLDELNGGFFPGQMVIIGARPSIGKSAFAGQIARNVATQGHKVGIISLEMNNNEIAARLAALDTSIEFRNIYRNLFRDEAQKEYFYNRVNSGTSKLPIFITDKTGVSINDIRAGAAALKSRFGLELLMIDYLQLISTDGNKNKNRENEISEISRGCKILAKEMQIPVFMLCQLNREMTKRKGANRYPELSDLRESGSLEQDADAVMFLHRDWPMGIEKDEQGNSTEFEADLLIRKWRNGKLGHIAMEFSGPMMMFKERIKTGFVPYND